MHWLFLLAAIACEVAGTVSMRLSQGFTKPLPSVLIFVCYGVSFTFVTFALKKIELSVAYTIWSGIGTVAVVCIGIFCFGESTSLLKLCSILLVLLGVMGLKFSGA